MPATPFPTQFPSPFWDLLCAASIIGIWPRFIEPNLITTTHKTLSLPHLPAGLHQFKIVQISDLHLNPSVPKKFLKKLIAKIRRLRPDLIALTGDILCHGYLHDPQQILEFLQEMEAPYGCYASLGNHDYDGYVGINHQGEYDLLAPPKSPILNGFKRLIRPVKLTKTISANARKISLNTPLIDLLKKTPFKLLHNASISIPVKDTCLNICGLGEHMVGRLDAKEAFKDYHPDYTGLILLHNPDGLPHIEDYPGDIVLCGHTHGGQINLPWIWKKFTVLENMHFKKGSFQIGDKWIYVNRGTGGILPLRLFSPPEILSLTLEKQ